jgi:phage gp36-like protein
MPYATRTDLEERYGADELAQRESVLPAGAVDRALADADVEIDSYLATRYSVPMSPVPGNVTRIAAAIARYRLLGDSVTELARKDYEDARAWLKDVAAGRVQINGATPLAAAAPSAVVEYVVGRDKAFTGGIQ